MSNLTRHACLILLLAATGMLYGCSYLSPGKQDTGSSAGYSPLGTLRLSPDLVSLEIAVATLDGDALDSFQQVWSSADIQSLPLKVRQDLDRNGFRVGILGTQLPGSLTAALAWSQPLLTEDGDILFNSRTPLPPNTNNQAFSVKQIEQLNSGDQHWVPCSAPHDNLIWQIDNGTSRRSGVCQLAQCGFMISQVPVGDQAIKLWFRPVIQHGETRFRYGIDQETLLIQEKQQQLRLEELDFVQRLRLGQTLIVTTTDKPLGLGQAFFASGRFSSSRQVLLIRPVSIGQDDLFAPEQTTRRLSTSLD